MKIKFLKSHPAYAYFVGDVAEVNDPKDLLEGKFAEPVIEVAEKATTKVKTQKAAK